MFESLLPVRPRAEKVVRAIVSDRPRVRPRARGDEGLRSEPFGPWRRATLLLRTPGRTRMEDPWPAAVVRERPGLRVPALAGRSEVGSAGSGPHIFASSAPLRASRSRPHVSSDDLGFSRSCPTWDNPGMTTAKKKVQSPLPPGKV